MRSPTKWVELAVAVLGLVIRVGGTTKADLILDQSFSQGSYIASTGGEFAQTFTVGLNGLLGQVDIGVQTLTNATLDIVRTSAAGIPSNDPSAVLASMSLPTVALSGTPALPTWVGIDLSAYDIQVNTGEILALTLQGGEVWFVGFSNHVPRDFIRNKDFATVSVAACGSEHEDCVIHKPLPWQNPRLRLWCSVRHLSQCGSVSRRRGHARH